MPLNQAVTKDIEAAVSKARKIELAFGLCLGKKPDKTVLVTHKSKKPEILGKEARKNGETALFTFGLMSVKGSKMSLRLEGKTPPSLIKKTRLFLKEAGLSMKVLVVEADGTVLDEEDGTAEPRGDTPTAPKEAPTEPDAPSPNLEIDTERAGWLGDRLRALVPVVKKFASLNPEGGQHLIKAMRRGQKLLAAAKLDEAEEVIAKLEKLLQVTPLPQAPPMPESAPETPETPSEDVDEARQKIQRAFVQLLPNVQQFLKRAEPSHTSKAKKLVQACRAEIAGTDMKKAATLLSALKKFVEANLTTLPPQSKADLARDAIAAATGPAPVERYEQAAGIMGKYPQGATAARKAMDKFAEVLGDQPATGDLIEQARKDIETAKQVLEDARKRLERAEALPYGEAKQKAIEAAQGDVTAAEGKLTDTQAFEKAAVAQKALTDALNFGPLSANSGQSLSDEAAVALIEGFTRDPGLAQTALEAAASSEFPDAVALNLGDLIDRKESGFASATGQHFIHEDYADQYAKNLLQMGANTGPDFFDKMSDYMASGRQFVADPLGDQGIVADTARAQNRSVKLGAALLDSNGHVDVTSQAAKDAVGDLLFNPMSLLNATPAMNKHVIATLDVFGDPTSGAKANAILDDIPDTTPSSSKGLVRRALRKGSTDAVAKRDVQAAVLASMLKPLDQGPVGSCFSTGPCRRMRETDPLAAMEAYASIAGTGKYKPANGPEVPVVTRIPANEDPIMRSWEYSMATSTARTASSSQKEFVSAISENAVDWLGDRITEHFSNPAKGDGGLVGWGKSKVQKLLGKGRLKELKKNIMDGCEFVYDSTAAIGLASDGSSSSGRYVMRRKDTGAEITNKEDYGDYVADQAIAAYGIDPTTALANDLRDLCKRADVLDDMSYTNDKGEVFAPWAMPGGGQGGPATQTLFGKGKKIKEITSEGSDSDSKADQTKRVLTKLMESFVGSSEEMMTVETIGHHTFNALPNDPSLEPLKKGGKSKLAENIQCELGDKAQSLKDTAFDNDKTGYLFDRIARNVAGDVPDGFDQVKRKLEEALAARRPDAGKTPEEIKALIDQAIHDTRPHYPNGNEDVWENYLKNAGAGKVQTEVLRDAGVQDFVIADTNWGSATDHTFLVVAPDPLSGEMAMFLKTVPPGSLSPADGSWSSSKWTGIK